MRHVALDRNQTLGNHMREVIPPTHGGTQMPAKLKTCKQDSTRAEASLMGLLH